MDTVPAETYAQFVDDHVAVALRRNERSLGESAIRLGSAEARDLLASRAFGRPVDHAEAVASAHAGGLGGSASTVDPWALAELARVMAAQRLRESDLADAYALFEAARSSGADALDTHQQSMHLHLAARFAASPAAYQEVADGYHRIFSLVRIMIECNRLLPQRKPRRWLRELGRLVHARCRLESGEGHGLSRLEARARPVRHATAAVSVVLAADSDPTLGLRSLLRQTYRNLDVLVVTERPLEADAAALLERLPSARSVVVPDAGFGQRVNRGLSESENDLILVLSPSEWAAPSMIETLVRQVTRSTEIAAARPSRLRADADLRLGPFGTARPETHSGSLLIRREAYDRVGAFDPASPSPDEYAARVKSAFGKGSVIGNKTKVLCLIADEREFTPHVEIQEGLADEGAVAYRSAYTRWHRDFADAQEAPYLDLDSPDRPFALPPSMRALAEPPAYDLVYASDWRPFGGPAKSMMEEIAAALRLGLRVGVMNLEAVRMMSPITRPLCAPIQRLISDGVVDVVSPGDEVDIDTLIIRYPLVLQFDRDLEARCRPRRVLIHANQPPCEADGSDLRYFIHHCEANTERWFGVAPSWVPQGPQARRALVESPVPPQRLEPFDMPGILDVADWTLSRDGFRSDVPVLGRHSRDHVTKWPGDRESMLQAYPDDPAYDFRNMGGATVPREVLGGRLPANWIAYGYDETEVRDFLFQLDFWVYFPNEIRIEAFGRAVLEAMAAGCVVVLPESFRSTFGEGALYCAPGEVRNLVDKYHGDREAFLSQSRLGQRHVREHFSYEWYQRLLTGTLGQRARTH